jgi:hypothetical protein
MKKRIKETIEKLMNERVCAFSVFSVSVCVGVCLVCV